MGRGIQEHSEFAIALAKALNVADEGAHWRYAPDTGLDHLLTLINANNRGEVLDISEVWNRKGRATIDGRLTHEQHKVHYVSAYSGSGDPTNPVATFSLDRDPAAVARDIARKVLPAYRELLALLNERLDRNDRAERLRCRGAGKLAALVGEEQHDGRFRWYRSDGAWGSGEVSASSEHTHVNLDLRNLTEEQAAAILKMLSK